VFRHIVLFRVHDDIPDTEVERAVAGLRALGSEIEASAWSVEISLDTRKGRVIVEDAAFADDAAFERFRVHPPHVAAAQMMAQIADWWVGDYHVRDN
jgi:hypothetical protein